MAAFDLLSDTSFAEEAAKAVDAFVHEHEYPVARAQIHGLRQIAINQPTQITVFADHQKDRAEKRNASAQVEFWKLVHLLCNGRPPRASWSLEQAAENVMPAELRLETAAHGTKLSKEEQQERAATKQRQKQWLESWRSEHYPEFFQRFCAHYLYRLGMKGD